jgi:anti-sigma regulatory factor (Ser/Thr protein kinase)
MPDAASQPCEQRDEFFVRAEMGDIRVASSWLADTGAECGVPEEHVMRLDQCLDEVLANVIAHGGPSAHAVPIALVLDVCRKTGGNEAALTVSDAGIAFDPLDAPAGSRPASLQEAAPGGLGLTMMRHFADGLSYRREGGRNHLTVVVRWLDAAD